MNIEQSKKLSIIDFLDKENVTLKKEEGQCLLVSVTLQGREDRIVQGQQEGEPVVRLRH